MDYVRDSDGDPSSWPLPVLANIVEKIATKFTRFFLIMDGLDDIPSSELAQFLDVLEDLRNTRVKKLRMAVFSRDIVAIRQWLSPNVEVPCTASDTATDIEAYIGSELDKHLKFPEMKDRIKDKLAEGADGMYANQKFLWASLATKYICHLQTEDDICQSLLSFPPDINTAYADAIGRILKFPGKYATQRGIAVLTWVLGAACPLTLNELAEAVAIEEMDGTQWDGSKVVKDPRVLIENCAGLCVVTTRDTVVLIHNSVVDYLFEYRMTMGDKFLLFPENLQEVHLQLAESCLKYMKLRSAEPSKGVQSRASSEPKRKNWSSGYLADYIFWHFVYHCRLAPTERRVLLEKRTEEVRGGRMNKLPGLHHPSTIPELHQNCERAISVVNPHGDTDALSDVEAVTLPLFRALNTASPGILSFSELSAAYRNRDGDGTSPFEEGTVRLLIAKFDTQFLGGITAAQFTKLHAWVESWTAVFDKVDRDGDGMIRSDELVEALKFLGFTVSVRAMALFERRYAERSTDGRMGVRLDRFIKSCVTFEAVKGKFHERDTRKEGFIHLTLEQLLDTFLDTPV
ncbi:hypothetical protein PHLCEN_2v5284 [Hermanssonia centrifuga]|uniref:EF-hand domain-containing protein n=1 Tax=Hermanssonia centrifuga TaxID=98765 RepID=A0A2R6P8F2_9APHY|nr:hypothetical protein PHLCEN_2v5284 [Hermanssonia centrifuga]